MNRACLLALALAGLALSGAAAAPGRREGRALLLESTPEAVRFRVTFDAPEPGPLPQGAESHSTWRWAGLPTSIALPHRLDLPGVLVRVAVPAGGTVTLAERPQDGGRARDLRLPAAGGAPARDEAALPPTHAVIEALGMERGLRVATVVVRPLRGAGGDAVWAHSVEVTVRIEGGARAVPAVERPASPDEASSSRTLLNPGAAPRLRVAADPPPPPGGIPGVWFDDASGWAKIEITRNGVTTLTRDALQAAGVPVSTLDPGTLRLFAGSLVPETPWAQLGWDTLLTGRVIDGWRHVYDRPGFQGGFADSGSLNEVAIQVTGEADGRLDAGDRVVFYALGPDNYRDRFALPPAPEPFLPNPYTDRTVYWLAWTDAGAPGFPEAPLRMDIVDAAPDSQATVVQTGTHRVHAERNTLYSPSLSAPGYRTENWFWDVFFGPVPGLRYAVDLPFAVPFAPLSAQIRLWGANVPAPGGSGADTLHHVQVDVNGQTAGIFTWGGTTYESALGPRDIRVSGFPASNPTEFIFRIPQVGAAGRTDQQYLAWIDVTYLRSLSFGGAGEVSVDAGAAGRTLHLTRVPEGTVEAYDVSDPRRPRRLVNGTLGGASGNRTLDLAFDRPDSGVVALPDPAAPQAPARIVLDSAPPNPAGAATWLRDTAEPLDYVILAHDDFAGEAEALAERRRAHLSGITETRPARVRVVRVSDVMDEFGEGMFDPQALRHFLEYAYRYYGNVLMDDRLRYTLFVGDHSYDFRNFTGTGSRSWVPSWEENRESLDDVTLALGPVQYASDDYLGSFDGPGDPYPDVALGRVPVATAAEARLVLGDKIAASETDPQYGTWRAKVLLAADDVCQGGDPDPTGGDGEFLDIVETVDAFLPPAFDRDKVYLVEYGTDCSIAVKPQAAADFKAAWTAGAWLVNYVGHGSETFLADERLLALADVPTLTNGPRLPLFIATSSKSGKFNLPTQIPMVEALVRSPQGGALAGMGSASNQTFEVDWLTLEFVNRLFPGGDPAAPQAMGLAFWEGKGNTPGLTDKYVFLGDPAQEPPVPDLRAAVAAPDTLVRGAIAAVALTVEGDAGRDGTADLRAEEPPPPFIPIGFFGYILPGDVMFSGLSPVAGDTAAPGFTVPAAAPTGPGARVRGYAWGADWDALGVDSATVAGTADPLADALPPVITFLAHPATMAPGQILTATLEDPSGIRAAAGAEPPAVEMVVRDAAGAEVFRTTLTSRFVYDLGSHTRGTVPFAIPDLEEGTYTFALAAEDNYGNRAVGTIELRVSAAAAGVRFIQVYAYPNPFPDATDVVFQLDRDIAVTVRIFSVSGRTVRKAVVDGAPGANAYHWDGRDEAGDPVANGVYLLQLSAGNAGDPVTHLERLVVLR